MRTFDVYSKRENGGLPILNNAQLMVGNGQTVIFENGQAVEPVSEDTARLLATRDDLTVVPHTGDDPFGDEPGPPAEPEATEADYERKARQEVERELAEARQELAEARGSVPPSDPAPAPQEPPSAPEATDLTPEQQAQLDAAREHLADEGEDVPDVVAKVDTGDVQVPPGFEARTGEGRPRCLAAKGDGAQCSNEAQGDTHACGLAPHKKQVADLPRV